MTEFKAGNIEFAQLAQITTDFYDSPWNPFDLARVVEQQTDTMALLSEFRQAEIITARHLADFFSWTFDSRYDRVYALVVVGNHPNQVSLVHCGVPEPAWVTKANQANPTHKAPHALHVSPPCVCPSVCVCCLFIQLILVVNRRSCMFVAFCIFAGVFHVVKIIVREAANRTTHACIAINRHSCQVKSCWRLRRH